MPSSDDKVILVVTTFKEQNNLETTTNVSNIIASSEPQKTLTVTPQSTSINNLVVTNTTPSQLIIQPNQTLNIVATTQTTSTILSAQSVGPALSGPQGIQGNIGPIGPTGPTGSIGPTGAAGISGYGYTGAIITGDYLYISQVDPDGAVGVAYSIGYVRGNTGNTGNIGNTGNTGNTGAAGISGYGYTGAQVIGDYLYISQIDPSGTIGSQYSIGYIRGNTGIQGNTGATGPVDLYVRTLEGLTGNLTLKQGTAISISNNGITDITIGANIAQVTKSTSSAGLGVAVFDSDDFRLSSGLVRLNKTTLKAQSGNFSSTDSFAVTFRGITGQPITTSISGNDILFNISSATSGACGIAYYDSSDFNIAADGKVTLNGAVRSLAGCTGILGITGVSGEVEITYSCPTITIGLPNDVTINNLNILGTFSGILDGGSY